MSVGSSASRGLLRPPPVVAALAFAKLALLLGCATAYGYHRDELYGLSCARRLAWGYMDHGPLSIAVLYAAGKVYGQTLLSMRVVPALLGTVVVILTARLARRFGAGTPGQGLAALCVVVSPDLLRIDHIHSLRSVEVLAWVATTGLVARALTAPEERATRAWLGAGVGAGLCLLDTLESGVFLAALALGVALTPSRARLRTRAPWLAVGVAAVVASPYLAWERANGWPTWSLFARTLRASVAAATPLRFALAEVTGMLPTSAIVWGVGLGALLGSPRLRTYRALGVPFVVASLVFALTAGTRTELLAPAFPVLFAAGAAVLEPWLTARRWAPPLLAAALVLPSVVTVPLAIPLLSFGKYRRFARALHLAPPLAEETSTPDRFAAMFGWPELVRTVGTVVDGLSAEEAAEAVILASNEGRAGAVDAFGPALGLPPVISGYRSYWLWGTAGASGKVVVAVGGDEALLRAHFRSVEVATVFGHSLAAPDERRVKIYLCREPVAPLDVMWPDFRSDG